MSACLSVSMLEAFPATNPISSLLKSFVMFSSLSIIMTSWSSKNSVAIRQPNSVAPNIIIFMPMNILQLILEVNPESI